MLDGSLCFGRLKAKKVVNTPSIQNAEWDLQAVLVLYKELSVERGLGKITPGDYT